MSSVERFIEEMGMMFQDGGDPRISGRIFGLLVIEGRELSLQQISDLLGVSRASVSTNARQLAKRGVIRLTTHSGDRQDFYELNNFPTIDMLSEVADRLLRNARAVEAYVSPLQGEDAGAAGRVAELSKTFGQAASMINDWAAAMRNEQTIRKDKK